MLTYRIAAFGCWNNRYNKRNKTIKDDSDVYLNLVMESLKYYERNYQDLIILGDNYYPLKNKDKKKDKSKDEKKEESKDEKKEESILTKYFNIFGGGEGDKPKEPKVKANIFVKDDIEYGFNKLMNINIKNKYLIMGNHDIEDFIGCEGLKYQLDLPNINIMFPFKSKDVIVNVNGIDLVYKYIFIDTSLFNIKDYDDPNIMPCFVNDEIKPKYDVQYSNSKDISIAQSKFLRDELNKDNIHHFLIFGHEPIFSLKTKINDEGQLKDKKGCLNILADIIFDNMKLNNITYICADVHMFQTGYITNPTKNPDKFIKQIVVGTGGAELDDCIECNNKKSEIIFNSQLYSYHIREINKSFGFVDILLDGSIKLNYVYNILGEQDNDISAFQQTGGNYKVKLNNYNISNFV